MRDRLLKLRRQQLRRPLPMRVFALFMVISVITVTNPSSVVRAATDDSTYFQAHITGYPEAADSYITTTYNLYVPSSEITFSNFPVTGHAETELTIEPDDTTDDVTDWKVNESSTSPNKQTVVGYYTYTWDRSSVAVGETANYKATYGYYTRSGDTDTPFTSKINLLFY